MSMKSMKLYDRVERIHNELRAHGIADDAPLHEADLTPFDQFHYNGTAAVDEAIATLGLGPDDRVLDVGAGLGGPARYIADTVGCHVVAVELQADVHETARELTRRCGLADRVEHVCADILDGPPGSEPYDALVSWLAFLHIADRPRLLATCAVALRPGGGLYVEDFAKRREPDAAQWRDLRVKVQTPYLPTLPEYAAQVRTAGFDPVRVDDLSDAFAAFTAGRLAAFRAARARHVAVHGEETTAGLEDFFATVAGLYADGVLGGARVVAGRAATSR